MAITTTSTGELVGITADQLEALHGHIEMGGIGVLHSDTVPAAVCRAFSVQTLRQLDVLLDHAETPYSVNFATAAAVEPWIEPSAADLRLLDAHTPGRITLVSGVNSNAPAVARLSRALNSDGATLGVRVSSSRVEQKLAKLAGGPVVTAAIRIAGKPAATVEDAAEFLREQIGKTDVRQRILVVCDGANRVNTEPSTVVRTRRDGQWSTAEVLREGAVAASELNVTVRTVWTSREIEDVT